MRQTLLAVPLLFAAACSYPQFVASRSVDFTVPAETIQALACESHNGGIEVQGSPDTNEIVVHLDITARGYTQAEANANLALLDAGREALNERLRLFGKIDPQLPDSVSPSFGWQLKVPQRVAVDLQSHNGEILLRGTDGKVQIVTHNGGVEAHVGSGDIAVETHNGSVKIAVVGEGALQGKVVSHNGSIHLELDGGRNTNVEAATHNGRVTTQHADARFDEDHGQASLKLGTGGGQLVATTHNGDIDIR